LCGLVGSLLTVTCNVADSEAATVGLNVTAIVHEELPPRFGPQVPPVTVKSAAFVPLTPLLTESVKGDLFVTVALSVLDLGRTTVP
jgi:hypothetical protein